MIFQVILFPANTFELPFEAPLEFLKHISISVHTSDVPVSEVSRVHSASPITGAVSTPVPLSEGLQEEAGLERPPPGRTCPLPPLLLLVLLLTPEPLGFP